MAYNRRYNPDALPAHIEPEQAAAILTNSRQDSYSSRPAPAPPMPSDRDRRDRDRDRDSYRATPVNSPRLPPNNSGSSRNSTSTYPDRSRPPPGQRDSYSSRSADDSRSARQSSYGSSKYDDRYDDRDRQRDRDRERDRERDRDKDRDYQAGGGSSSRRGPLPVAPPAGTSAYRNDRGSSGNWAGPPSAPMPQNTERDALWPMFRAVDKDNSGALSEHELGTALVNGDYTSFDPHTVKMMIRMFDFDHSGTIDFDEFCSLWGFLTSWRHLFDRFDVDRSGTISLDEFTSALTAFGYRLSPQYVRQLFDAYDLKGRGVLSFDLFVQSCISLKRMTDVFRKYDDDRDGYITLSFEQFLTGTQALYLHNSISDKTDRGVY